MTRALVPVEVLDPDEVTGGTTTLAVPSSIRRPDENPAVLYLASLAKGSRRAQLGALSTIAGFFGQDPYLMPWHKLTPGQTVVIRTKLAEVYAPATANRMLSALRGVLNECKRVGILDAAMCDRLGDLKRVAGSREPAGRFLEPHEVTGLLDACTRAGDKQDIRDAAIIAVLGYGGVRRAEAVAALVRNLNIPQSSITIIGKGNKQRTVFLGDEGMAYLQAWMSIRPEGDPDDGTIFTHIERPKRLTPESVFVLLRRAAPLAGIDPQSFSPHDFRRTFVSTLLDQGEGLEIAQKLAGHASPITTARYDRRKQEVLREAARRISYRKRP